MYSSFVAFDVETATFERNSICEIGIAIVKNGEIAERKSWLVQPPHNEYDDFNTYLHGIGPNDTKDKPLFPEVWKEVIPFLENRIVVCHNAAFDMGALRDALTLYDIMYPTFDIMCTLRVSRKTIPGFSSYTLDSVYTNLFGKELKNHHRAGDDAAACAEILLECLSRNEISCREEIEEKFALKIGHISPEYYCNQHAKKVGGGGTLVRAKDIVGDSEKIDPDNYFFEKTVCFTGAFFFCTRKELQQYIADVGGIPVDGVTKKTDILVVGQQDFRVVGASGMSSKQRKALDLLSKGQEIEILSEKDFLSFTSDFRANERSAKPKNKRSFVNTSCSNGTITVSIDMECNAPC
ncbi:MAG: 3'-5' exoribonuclease [Muribaculaceae bacterium]|nr:3'-5' exoribonuclease [Muribaculaceae bacterium]